MLSVRLKSFGCKFRQIATDEEVGLMPKWIFCVPLVLYNFLGSYCKSVPFGRRKPAARYVGACYRSFLITNGAHFIKFNFK